MLDDEIAQNTINLLFFRHVTMIVFGGEYGYYLQQEAFLVHM